MDSKDALQEFEDLLNEIRDDIKNEDPGVTLIKQVYWENALGQILIMANLDMFSHAYINNAFYWLGKDGRNCTIDQQVVSIVKRWRNNEIDKPTESEKKVLENHPVTQFGDKTKEGCSGRIIVGKDKLTSDQIKQLDEAILKIAEKKADDNYKS